MAAGIRISATILEEMILYARRESPNECCGLLAGRDNVITEIFPTKNALASTAAYEIAPLEVFQLFRHMREQGLQHLGIYHSHPRTENAPSARDIEQSYYPDQVYFIISPEAGISRPVRAFSIRGGEVQELEIVEVGDSDAKRRRSE